MKFRKIAMILTLALSVPLSSLGSPSAWAQTSPPAPVDQSMSPDAIAPGMEQTLDMAKDRLDKSKVRLDIAQKQVEAAKARLKAAEAEFKAAKANHEAKSLENQAKKLSDASGLPEISEGQIQQGRNKSLASAFTFGKSKEKTDAVDLSKTRLKQVDFNAQPFDHSTAPAGTQMEQAPPAQIENGKPTSDAPAPDKQAQFDANGQGAPAPQGGLMAATQPAALSEQPPIVP